MDSNLSILIRYYCIEALEWLDKGLTLVPLDVVAKSSNQGAPSPDAATCRFGTKHIPVPDPRDSGAHSQSS